MNSSLGNHRLGWGLRHVWEQHFHTDRTPLLPSASKPSPDADPNRECGRDVARRGKCSFSRSCFYVHSWSGPPPSTMWVLKNHCGDIGQCGTHFGVPIWEVVERPTLFNVSTLIFFKPTLCKGGVPAACVGFATFSCRTPLLDPPQNCWFLGQIRDWKHIYVRLLYLRCSGVLPVLSFTSYPNVHHPAIDYCVLSLQCGWAMAAFMSSRHRDFGDFVAEFWNCGSGSLNSFFLELWPSSFLLHHRWAVLVRTTWSSIL